MIPRSLTDPRLIRTAAMLVLLQCGLTNAQAQSADDTAFRAERMQVEHRNPARLLTELRPLIGQGASIGVVGDWLIVAASGNDRARVRDQLEELDSPPSSVRIRLTFPVDDESEESEAGATDDQTAAAPQPRQRELEADIGQTITLNLANDPDQLSLRVDLDGRRMLLSWRILPGDASAGSSPEQQTALMADEWQALVRGIRIQLEPLR